MVKLKEVLEGMEVLLKININYFILNFNEKARSSEAQPLGGDDHKIE